MKRLLLVVDMQNDFVTGTLGTKEATQIIDNVVNKIKQSIKHDDSIIFTKDTHYEDYLNSNEGQNLPVEHCIKDTNGWNIIPEITSIMDLNPYKVYNKITFGSSELAKDLLEGKYDHIEEFEIIGLCTDICVISNALIIKAFRPEIPIIVDSSCCAGVRVESHMNALNAMRMCQIIIK